MGWCNQKNREKRFMASPSRGKCYAWRIGDVCEPCLVKEYAAFDSGICKPNAASLSEVARQLRLLSGRYDQPARSANIFLHYDLYNICRGSG